MTRTKVVHCKQEKYDLYIGRPSPFGNPYSHKPGTKAEFIVPTRAEAIAKYREWIIKQPHLMQQLPSLKGKVLGCWCKPLSCHGDVLVDLIEGNEPVEPENKDTNKYDLN